MKSKRHLASIIILTATLIFLSVTVFSGCNTIAAIAVKKLGNSGYELITDNSYKEYELWDSYAIDFSAAVVEGSFEFCLDSVPSCIIYHPVFKNNSYITYSSEYALFTRIIKISENPFTTTRFYIKNIYFLEGAIGVFTSGNGIINQFIYYKDINILAVHSSVTMQSAIEYTKDTSSLDFESLEYKESHLNIALYFKAVEKTDGQIRVISNK